MHTCDIPREHLQRALRCGQIAVWEWDLETHGLAWSDNVAEILGGTFEIQKAFEACIHPDDQERHRAALERTFSEGEPYDLEMRFIKPDGTVIWIHDKAELQIDHTDRRILSGVTIDISAKKEAEIDAQAKTACLKVTLEHMDQGLLMYDAQGIIRVYNKRVLELLDLPEELMASQPSFQTVREYQLEHGEFVCSDESFRQWVATSGFTEGVYERERPNGTVLEVRTVPLPSGGAVRTFTDITARKTAEAEAKEKAADLEATLGHMDQGFLMYDPYGAIRVYNTKVLELLDLPEELLASHPSYQAVLDYQLEHGDFALCDESLREWILTSGFRETSTYERVRPNGLMLEIRTVLLPNGGAVRTYTDVTARRQAETELRESEERYRTLVAASSTIVWRAAPDGSVIEGTGWSKYTGLSVEESIGHGWFKTIHPDDRGRQIEVWQAALASGSPFENDYRVRRHDGEYNWCIARGAPVKNPDGSVREWVGTLTDVHEHKTVVLALEESQRRLSTLVDNLPGLAYRCLNKPEWPMEYISEGVRAISGYAPADFQGPQALAWADLMDPDDRELIWDEVQTAAREHRSFEFTYRVRTKEGQQRWVWERGQAIFDASGELEALEGFISDITEQRRTEEALRQSQKMEAVGQLTGGVAHDFNNLLTVILGNAELLAEHLPDPRFRAMAQMILEGAERGAQLTRHLLAFGRRQSLNPQRLSLNEVVRGILPLLQRATGEHIELRTEFSHSLLLALADRALLGTAILNLAVNARDAMPQGGVLTIVTGEGIAGPENGQLPVGQAVVFVMVSDNGSGMNPQVLERAFEPFFTTKEVGQGSGLGLSMVYGFAEQSGGHVSIQSKEGEGTAVTIMLQAITSNTAQPALEAEEPAPKTGKERVLLVEDEPQVLQFVSSQLLSLGYEVTAVSTGPDALDVLRQGNRFDLLFTDVVLPQGISGVELAKQAKQISPDLKVLLTSGYSEDVFEHHGRPPEGTLLLRKPYKRKELAETLRNVLGSEAPNASRA